ncbi:cell division control protein 6 homolog B-like [Macadamia integrifolia]|uniref:cell division control protein 6 homolog B-like n=1 Tax=Macadamia integrifolia TaxID=60698 RepID=UPI001C52F343|nr:cell division control protein 6 homolog B-like [Macadamia integrifolia]
MPTIIGNGSSVFYDAVDSGGRDAAMEKKSIGIDKSANMRSKQHSTAQKRRLRSESELCSSISTPSKSCSPKKWKSPRKCISSSPSTNGNENRALRTTKSPRKRLSDSFPQNSKWNPKDPYQMRIVKEALHVSTAQSIIVCREEEQKRVLEFCKACIEQQKAGSLYACGCPGTGKTLSMEKVKQSLLEWINEEGFQSPDVLAINCTSLSKTSDIFSKISEKHCPRKKINGYSTPLQYLRNLFSQKHPSSEKMTLVIVDELDYLITKDGSVLHDLFMLTTFPFSRFILIGIANALDLADRFLPKLQSLNCKPVVITFRAYSKDQILKILQQRLMALPYTVFQPQALELCARKVAAVSGDMRKALSVCRSVFC